MSPSDVQCGDTVLTVGKAISDTELLDIICGDSHVDLSGIITHSDVEAEQPADEPEPDTGKKAAAEGTALIPGVKVISKIDLNALKRPVKKKKEPKTVAPVEVFKTTPPTKPEKEFVPTQYIKLEGPKVVSKIDLSQFNKGDDGKKKRKHIKKDGEKVDSESAANNILQNAIDDFDDYLEIPSVQRGAVSSSVTAYFNEGILKQLQNMLTMAKQSVKIAVSWFTNYTLFKQIGQLAEAGVKIQLIINNDLVNNGGYCLNFNDLIGKGVEISLVEYPHLLHHKFAIIDDEQLVTGSYNWTRFSGKNYENMVVIDDATIVDQFRKEFEYLLDKAEYKCIDRMPEYVKERPEYDRSAFKQYITEELDAQARESTDERDKITALKKACELNPTYLEKINPGVQEKYRESFNVIDDTRSIQKTVIEQSQINKAARPSLKDFASPKTEVTPAPETQVGKVLTRDQEKTIEKAAASSLIMVLDVSGSMAETYTKGHVHEITKKALAASIVLTKKHEANVWTFGNDANYIGSFGLNQIDQIKQINCKNEGTNLQNFVVRANNSIVDGALCIIFTDDDLSSISSAVEGMKKREQVFWQIISYERNLKNIEASINGIRNISVVTLSDYQNRTTEEINSILLHDYLNWKNY